MVTSMKPVRLINRRDILEQVSEKYYLRDIGKVHDETIQVMIESFIYLIIKNDILVRLYDETT